MRALRRIRDSRHRRLWIGGVGLAAFAAAFAVAATLTLTLSSFGATSTAVAACDSSISSSWTTSFDSTIGEYAVDTVTVGGISNTCSNNTLKVQLVKADDTALGTAQSVDLGDLSGGDNDNPQQFDVSGQHLSAADVDHVAAVLAAT
jgi:hypothetical protein